MPRAYLVIESATPHGSVALAGQGGDVLAASDFVARDPATGTLTEALAPAIVALAREADVSIADLEGIVCDAGPGGFTSLRVAAAIAKGICACSDARLFAASSLQILAWSARVDAGRYTAAIGAGRGEWFAADFARASSGEVTLGEMRLVSDDTLKRESATTRTPLVGRGLDIDAVPLAIAVAPHVHDVVARGCVDLESWEPAYGRLAEAQVKWQAAHGRALA